MILIVCKSCALCLRVMGDPAELTHLVGEKSDFWPDDFMCPSCERPCPGVLEKDTDPRVLNSLTLIDLNPQEAFAAMHGMGLPNEADCRKEVILELLRTQPVKEARLRDIPNTQRCRIDWLELQDGTKLYFGAGAEGAVVFRVTKPTSYVEKIDGG